MVFLGNLILLVFILLIFAVQIDKYNEIILDKYRFRYFALRDRLAMLVVNRKLEEGSWEYQRIIDAVNFHINAIETVSIQDIICLLIDYHTSPEEECKVEIIKKKLDHPEIIEIMAEFMDITGQLLERNSRMQIKLLKNFNKNKHAQDMRSISSHKAALDKVRSYRDELRGSLEAKVALA